MLQVYKDAGTVLCRKFYVEYLWALCSWCVMGYLHHMFCMHVRVLDVKREEEA